MPEPATLAARLASRGTLELTRAFGARGAVASVVDGVARVVGLPEVGSEELVRFDSGTLGMAYELGAEDLGVVLLGAADRVTVGEGVEATGGLPSLEASDELLGRVVDPLGGALDDGPRVAGERLALFREPPDLLERAPVDRPLLTGVMVVDTTTPIGRGQRQLIVGDRNVGKTALALDIIAAQRPEDVVCVYVAVGQPMSRTLAIREALDKNGALRNTVIVGSEAADAPGLQYLAPYAGAAVSEYFRSRGRDALVVYDDLTKHADAYRELALLLGRSPGREAFPGDIFYVHAQLLERATAFKPEAGGGSVTAFPIVETTDSDISAYIPTNLISITDGQIYLDSGRFERNERPAVDIGRSVSRVGGAAQARVIRSAARNLRITMSRFEALESLTRVGLDVDPQTRQAVRRGRILRELLRQCRFSPRSPAVQVLALLAVSEGWLDALEPEAARAALNDAEARAERELPELLRALDADEELPGGWKERLRPSFQPAQEAVA